MAEAFPKSRFVGFDYHAASIEVARERAAGAGVADRVRFEVAAADAFGGKGYDLVAMFDALHDLGDPVGAARRACDALAPDGACMIVGAGLGAQAGEARLREVLVAGGFAAVRRAAETPLNLVIEARP